MDYYLELNDWYRYGEYDPSEDIDWDGEDYYNWLFSDDKNWVDQFTPKEDDILFEQELSGDLSGEDCLKWFFSNSVNFLLPA